MSDSKRELVDEIYEHVLTVVNRILHNTKNYNISILKLEDPSYSEIAKQLEKACVLMEVVADDMRDNGGTDHTYTVSKANEYLEHVVKIAQAINDEDEAALTKYRDELDRRSFL